jgi:hypothetical protein
VDARSLQVGGEGVEFTTRIRQVPFGQLRDNDASALNPYFQSVQFGGYFAQTVVGVVETFDDARVSGIVKPMGAQEQVETTERMRNLG